MELLKSAGFLIGGTFKRIQWYLPPLLLDPFDIAERVFGMKYIVPQWIALSLFVVGWLTAIVFTYHDLRKQKLILEKQLEKDKAMRPEQSLILTLHTYAIGLSGMTGYPDEPENTTWLFLEVFVNAIDRPIDTLDLIIDGKTIPANHWHGKNVTAFNVYFNVTEWRCKGKNQVELIAHVGDKMHRSGRKTIDFNVEPWGSHRI